MFNNIEKELIRNLEKCNYDYILTKESEKKYQKKVDFGIKRIIKSIGFRIRKFKYLRKYGVDNYPTNENDLGWNLNSNNTPICQDKEKKVVVYTCISGRYDSINEPLFNLNKNISYVLFTNQNITSNTWNIRPIPESLSYLSDVEKNRYLKMHPHELFEQFDYSIYVDGNVQVISDMSGLVNLIDDTIGFAMHFHRLRTCIYQEAVACQAHKKGNLQGIEEDIKKYLAENFPRNFGLLECTVIVTDLHHSISKHLFDEWWNEFVNSKSRRDQLSLPYILWKNNISIEKCGTLGYNLYRNPKFRVLSHIKK